MRFSVIMTIIQLYNHFVTEKLNETIDFDNQQSAGKSITPLCHERRNIHTLG